MVSNLKPYKESNEIKDFEHFGTHRQRADGIKILNQEDILKQHKERI